MLKSAGEIFLSGLRGAKIFPNAFRIVFRGPFLFFVFCIDLKIFSGAVSFCRHAALTLYVQCSVRMSRTRRSRTNFSNSFRDRRNHDTQDSTLFLRLVIGQFSPQFGAISLLNYAEPREKGKNPLEKKIQNNPEETAPPPPKNCRSLSLVVVECVMTIGKEIVTKLSFKECQTLYCNCQ